ncbi:MAG: TolC family protein [Myxococcales bacterium]|nr:TolC family protein [Myxococcales bacterium]
MPPAAREDAYGPRPAGVPMLSREQIVRYGLDNPYVHAADERVEAMETVLRQAKFAWVPIIKTSAVLTPGAAISCDDVTLQGADGPFSFQYCRASGDPADGSNPVDLQTVKGYFARIADAGVSLRLSADFVAPITTFGKIVTAQKLAKVAVELAELQRLATQQETILRIYQAYAALQLARQSISILDEAWGIVAKERVKIEQGLGLGPDGQPSFDADPSTLDPDRDPDDLVRLEVGEIELAERMREARLIESKALATLWAIAGTAAPRGFDIEARELRPDVIEGGLQDLAHYQALALKNRPEARLADAGVKARRVQEKLARTNFLPDLGAVVRLGYGYANEATRDMRTLYYTGRLNYSNIYFGLAMSWDLDFHNDVFALQRARAERREAEYQREAARRLLALEVEEAYRAVLDAEQQMRFSALARDKTWKLVVSEQASESIGASNFEDLRKALTKWAEFEFGHFEAIMNRNMALAKLSRAVGTPIVGP